MPLSLILSAAALTAPVYAVTLEDYPDKAFDKEQSAAVLADVVVDPKGRMLTCTVEKSDGAADLAARICSIYEKKRHVPAHFGNGDPAWFAETDVYRMTLPGTSASAAIEALRDNDAVFQVSSLPAGMDHLDAKLVVAVDVSGAITDCGPDAGDSESVVTQMVCSNTAVIPRDVFRTPEGEAVPYVSRIRVRFTLAEAVAQGPAR